MHAQLTVRLPENLAQRVADAARKLRLKRSDIVRLALDHYLGESFTQEEPAPYERVKRLVGSVNSAITDLGTSHREHLVKRMGRRG